MGARTLFIDWTISLRICKNMGTSLSSMGSLVIDSTHATVIYLVCFSYCSYVIVLYRHSTDREIAIMILMAYLSYILAEVKFTIHVDCWSKIILSQFAQVLLIFYYKQKIKNISEGPLYLYIHMLINLTPERGLCCSSST